MCVLVFNYVRVCVCVCVHVYARVQVDRAYALSNERRAMERNTLKNSLEQWTSDTECINTHSKYVHIRRNAHDCDLEYYFVCMYHVHMLFIVYSGIEICDS